jgi:hypothetical protein
MCIHTCTHTQLRIFFIHSSVVGHLGYFHSLPVVKRAVLNIGMQVSLLDIDLHSFACMPKSGMTGWKISLFLFFWGTFILIS